MEVKKMAIDPNTELMHYGKKGMKWGIITWRKNLKNRKKKRSDEEEPETPEQREQRKKDMLNRRDPKEIYANRHMFSPQELQAAFLVMNTENNIKKLIPEEKSKVQNAIDKTIKWGNNISNIAKTGNDVITNGQKFLKAVGVLNDKGKAPAQAPQAKPKKEKKEKKQNGNQPTVAEIVNEVGRTLNTQEIRRQLSTPNNWGYTSSGGSDNRSQWVHATQDNTRSTVSVNANRFRNNQRVEPPTRTEANSFIHDYIARETERSNRGASSSTNSSSTLRNTGDTVTNDTFTNGQNTSVPQNNDAFADEFRQRRD